MRLYGLKKYGIFICLIFVYGLFVFDGCTHDSSKEHVNNIIELCGNEDFNISTGNLGTSAKGTVLVYEKEKNVFSIRIVSFISIGSKDFGGVAFYLPVGCVLDDILCTYPENAKKIDRDSQVELWSTASENVQFCTTIEIGRSRSYKPTGGGNGTVLIDATFICDKESKKTVNALKFGVECGADFENGNVLMGIAGEEILVDIKRVD